MGKARAAFKAPKRKINFVSIFKNSKKSRLERNGSVRILFSVYLLVIIILLDYKYFISFPWS
jgi:hypothetical protein